MVRLITLFLILLICPALFAQDFDPPAVRTTRIAYVIELVGYQRFDHGQSFGSWVIRVEFRDAHEPKLFTVLLSSERYDCTNLGDIYTFHYLEGKLVGITGPTKP